MSSAGKFFACASCKSCARSEYLDATPFAAPTDRPSIINADVATLAGRTRSAMEYLSIHDNARSNPRSDGRVEDILVAARGAPACFRQCRCVRIVINFDRDRILFPHFFSERKIAPAGNVGRIENYTRFRIKRAGGANANSSDSGRTTRKSLCDR